ncbi:MAG: hypothetical protein HKN87_15630 [Saprospiraceae bacterium]|nr:hypothetical protein [Saprospiraceae bacterium]
MKYLLVITCGLLLTASMSAQSLEILDGSRTKKSERKFAFTSGAVDEYSVKVIGGKGEILVVPIAPKKMMEKETIKFLLDTNGWKPGSYMVVATSKKGKSVTKKIRITRKE